MPDKPGPAEIAFAQTRQKLQAALTPYFQDRAQACSRGMVGFGTKILMPTENERPLEHTLRGQTLCTYASFQDGGQVSLLLAHASGWEPVVSIHDTRGGAQPTVYIQRDMEASIAEIKRLIDAAFNRAA